MFLVGALILYFAFRGQDIRQIWLEIKSANFLWVFLSSLTVWLAHLLRAARWKMLYQSIAYKVPFWNAYHAVMVGYLANLALPRAGEVMRCSVLHRTNRVPVFASIGTVITERLFDVLILLLTSIALLIFQYQLVSDFLYQAIFIGIEKKIKGINYFWVITGLVIFAALIFLTSYFLWHKFRKKLLRVLVGLKQGFRSYGKVKHKGLFMLYTLSIWILYFLSMYFAFFAINATSSLGLNAAFAAIVFSGFAMAAPVQGGIGVFHWMVAQALVLYAVSFKDGLAYATIIHSSQTLLVLVLGAISLTVVLSRERK